MHTPLLYYLPVNVYNLAQKPLDTLKGWHLGLRQLNNYLASAKLLSQTRSRRWLV